MKLSIIIPGRNEEFFSRTVTDVLSKTGDQTEVIAVLDGAFANPGLEKHPRLQVIYNPISVGQRASCNQGAKIARGEYLMKLDAHCKVDNNFDEKMLSVAKPDLTIAPLMKNLHAFNWVCEDGHTRYQGPSGVCKDCGKPTTKDILWKEKPSPNSTSYRFDKTLHFQYFGEFKKRPEGKGPLSESMSLQGSCFMLHKDKWFDLDICEERLGSWGNQGTEVACKTWLSGGKVMIYHDTWYAHLFRTQGGDFGFPYPQDGKQVDRARELTREMFIDGKWSKAVKPLSWLIDKFKPVPGWHDKPTKGVVYYTDSELGEHIATQCIDQIKKGIKEKHVVSVSLKPLGFGKNITLDKERGNLTMFEQILAGLEASEADVVFLCEHDVLYHPSHFDFIPPDRSKVYYNVNVWKRRMSDGFSFRVNNCRQTSGLVAYRDVLVKHYRKRIERITLEGYSTAIGYEPGTHNREAKIDDLRSETYESKYPNVDLRHGKNLTKSRWSKDEFRNDKYTKGWIESFTIPGWSL